MFVIYKKFTFDAAHRILDHFGKCANIHGHTYQVIFKLESSELNDMNVVVDYYNFKPLKAIIDNEFDHSLIISEKDDEMLKIAINLGTKYIVLEDTTSEILAKHLFYRAKEFFKEVVSVEIKETEATGAVYHE